MSMILTWDVTDPTLLHWRCEGEWSWQEYFETLETLKNELEVHETSRVDIICEIAGSTMIQPGLVSNLQKNNPAMTADGGRWGITVIVGGGQFAKTSLGLLKMVNRFLGQRYYNADSLDEARGIIKLYRAGKTGQLSA